MNELKICSKCGKTKDIECFELHSVNKETGKINLRGQCKECRKNIRDNKKDLRIDYDKAKYKENRDKILERKKEYYRENREKILEYKSRYYIENIDKIKEYSKLYRSNCGEVRRVAEYKRRSLIKGYKYTNEEWEKCLEFFNNRCAYTGVELTKENTHRDHIIPLSKGGLNVIRNIVPALSSANISKRDKDMETWFRSKDFFDEGRLNRIIEWMKFNDVHALIDSIETLEDIFDI
ncbi:Uncharacterised protein [[Clostridium] sordellii]|uniref:HNH endonuclease signature motif containing protein n=1 Tax=Paraclostridium sordellii TaxID=1505 RepID=UPI0005DB1E64|nr:HNH endonuclease signature motif containing protein [Paeniclostridium sordellii]CEQ01716.1 Uncharacterised protein [[Clostridium] sordellii] [Paeniclostridium sordellii]